MKIESQVCSLNLAKRLKELGVKQESYLYWKLDPYGGSDEPYLIAYNSRYMTSAGEIIAAAFTVAELGELLPERVIYGTEDGDIAFYRQKLFDTEPRAEIFYSDSIDEHMKIPKDQSIRGMTEADARAAMLVYLIENKLASVR